MCLYIVQYQHNGVGTEKWNMTLYPHIKYVILLILQFNIGEEIMVDDELCVYSLQVGRMECAIELYYFCSKF